MLTLLALGLGANAQTMKVQSAYADMKNNRLADAKENIDAACVDESTMKDPKTWHYSGLIYAKLVEVSQTNEKLFKKQKVTIPLDQLAETARVNLMKSMDMEKAAGTSEYSAANVGTLSYIAAYQLNNAVAVFNSQKYADAIPMLEKVSAAAQYARNTELEQKAQYITAMAYTATKQPEKATELYRELVKNNTKEKTVYINLYLANKQAKEMDKAINVLKRGVKNLPEDYQMLGLLAGAYQEAGNKEEATKCIDQLKTMSQGKPEVMSIVGDVLRDGGNTDEAIKMYTQSLAAKPDQIESNFGIGTLYFNWAVDLKEKADKLPMEDQAGYDKLMKESKEKFALAIPYLEKVRTINPKHFQALKALKGIYSILEMKDKYQEVSAQLNTMIQK